VIRNSSGRLPKHFNFDAGAGLGIGLSLVKSLLPPEGARLRFESVPGASATEVELTLCPPTIALLPCAAPSATAIREPVHGAYSYSDRRG
jgi:hypothetical protein